MTNQAVAQQPSQAAEDILQKVQRQEYVAGEDVAKALQQQREEFKQQLEELKKQSEQQKAVSMFADLKREFSDFDEIVNPDTLALLDETYPRLAQTIAKSKDPYDAALLAYETIKAKGLTERVPDARRAKEVEKRLEQNKKTVQTPQAFEKRPMAQAFRMPETKQEKEAVYKEMLKYAQMAGGGY
jgi:alanyl-tRNA synthetase